MSAAAPAASPPAGAPRRAPTAAAASPPADATTATTPGARVVTAQAPVVGGNAAGARERALEDAIRQAVTLTLAEVVDPQTRAAQAKTIKAIEAKARSFVPRYRTLEEGEVGGMYSVRLEVEVDDIALRRRLERVGRATADHGDAPGASGRPVAAAGPRRPGRGHVDVQRCTSARRSPHRARPRSPPRASRRRWRAPPRPRSAPGWTRPC